jgi:hypothetical protein
MASCYPTIPRFRVDSCLIHDTIILIIIRIIKIRVLPICLLTANENSKN